MVACASKPPDGRSFVEVFTMDDQQNDWVQVGQTIYGVSTTAQDRFESISLSMDKTRLAISYFKFTQVYEWNNSTTLWVPIGPKLLVDEGNTEGSARMSGNGQVIVVGNPAKTFSNLTTGPTTVYEWID